MEFKLTGDREREAGFRAADGIRDLMNGFNREDIGGLTWECGDNADSVYAHLARALEAVFRQLGLSAQEAVTARMHTCDGSARGAYERVMAERPCMACQGRGGFGVYDPSTDALIGWRPCSECPPF